MLVLLQKELQSAEKGEDKLDWSTAAHHRTNERGGERGHRAAQDTENTGMDILREVKTHSLLKLLQPQVPFPTFVHQEAIIQIMKMRKRINNAQLQTELVEILKNMFLPQKKMIKEQIEWLIDHKYIKRDETDINTFIYMA